MISLTVVAADLPLRVRSDMQQYVEANPKRFDNVPWDDNAVWGLTDAIDAYLSWNGVIGFTPEIMDIVRTAIQTQQILDKLAK